MCGLDRQGVSWRVTQGGVGGRAVLHVLQRGHAALLIRITPRCTLQPSGMAVASKTDTSRWAPARAVAPLLCGPFLDQVVSIYDMRHIY